MLHGHGGDVYGLARELGRSVEDILDFSSNVNPLPLDREFLDFIRDHLGEIHFLPEVDSLQLRTTIAERYGLEPGDILVGTGTTQWIHGLPGAMGAEKVVIPLPTYADYEDAARQAGCKVEFSGPWPHADPAMNSEILEDIVKRSRSGSMVYLCNPNNPTGRFMDPGDILSAVQDSPGTTWVVDESYAQFLGPDEETSLLCRSMPPASRLVVLRSFSKIYGVPGLRLGYAAGKGLGSLAGLPELPWTVSRLAQIAGVFLLSRSQDIETQARAFIKQEKEYLFQEISSIRCLEPVANRIHFFPVHVRPPADALELYMNLRSYGILVRYCENFKGLGKNYIRLSPRLPEDNRRLVRILASLLA